MEECLVEKSNKWLLGMSSGKSNQLEALTLCGLQILHARQGFIRCRFVVSDSITDGEGNWQAGALATIIDDVGAAAIYSSVGHIKASVDLSISYYSPAKIHDEVEIEAKLVANKGRLSSVVVEVRRKDSGELIALGKQWMASNNNARL